MCSVLNICCTVCAVLNICCTVCAVLNFSAQCVLCLTFVARSLARFVHKAFVGSVVAVAGSFPCTAILVHVLAYLLDGRHPACLLAVLSWPGVGLAVRLDQTAELVGVLQHVAAACGGFFSRCDTALAAVVFPQLFDVDRAETASLAELFIGVAERHDGLPSVDAERVASVVHDRVFVVGLSEGGGLAGVVLLEVVTHSRLHVLPVDSDVAVTVSSGLFVVESQGMHHFVDGSAQVSVTTVS